MNCICQCWKDKAITLTCYRCNGIVNYIKVGKINEEDSKQVILEKLKKELKEKRTDITILKMEIQELENEIKEEDEECILSNGAVVSKAGLPNCDCSSCN